MLLAWYVGMNLSRGGVISTFKFTALLGVTVGLVLQCSAGEKHAGSAMNRQGSWEWCGLGGIGKESRA